MSIIILREIWIEDAEAIEDDQEGGAEGEGRDNVKKKNNSYICDYAIIYWII